MSVIDRGILDEAYDTSAGWLNATYVFKNFSLSAQTLEVPELLDGLDEASGNNPEVRTLTDLMREDPQLGATFRAHMVTHGRGTLRTIDELVEADGELTAEQIREAFPIARAGVDFEVSSGWGVEESDAAFLNAIGVTEAEYDRFGVMQDNDQILREVIGARTPEQFLDAVAETNPEAIETINLIKADPQLAEALHSAIASDPTMLEGLQGILAAEGEAGQTAIAELNEVLNSDMQRGVLTEVLQNIANDPGGTDINFSHLRAIMDADNMQERIAAVQAAGAGDSLNPLGGGVQGWQDFIHMLQSPEGDNLIADFVMSIEGLPPQMQEMLAGVMGFVRDLVAGFGDLDGEFLGHYYDKGGAILTGIGRDYGAPILQSFETRADGSERQVVVGERGNMTPEQIRAAAAEETANVDPANSPEAPTREVAEVVAPAERVGGLTGYSPA